MNIRRLSRLILGEAVFCFCLSGLCNSVYAGTLGLTSEQNISAVLNSTWLQVSTNGNISMSVVPTVNSSLVVSSGIVNVKTNSSTGYKLYASGYLYDADPSRKAGLYLDGTVGSSSIAAVPTTNSATPLGLNEWGIAVADTLDFSTTELYQDAIEQEVLTSESDMNALKWKGLRGDYQHLYTSTHDGSSTALDEDTTVYYGARVNTSRVTGNYRNTIVYTAFVDGGTAVNIAPNPVNLTTAGTSTTITVVTGHQSSSTPVTSDRITISLYDSSSPSSDIASCTNIAVLPDYDGTYGHPLRFTCTLTRLANAVGSLTNNYDVTVGIDLEDNGVYVSYDEQDSWRFISTWDYSLTFNGNGATSSTVPAKQEGTKTENENYIGNTGAAPTKADYSFAGWSDGTNTYAANTNITLTKDDPSKALVAIWNEVPITYSLLFDKGTQTGATNMPATVSATQNLSAGHSKSLTVPATMPTATDYNFLGWATTAERAAAGTVDYAKGSTHNITVSWSTGTNASTTLYAVWKLDYVPMTNNAYMQDMTAKSCKKATQWTSSNNVQYRLKDKRGSKYTYTIRKLADGNCWMVQNLALPGDTSISNTDSDLNTITSYKLPTSSNSTSNRWDDSTNTIGYMYNGNHSESATVDTEITTANTASSNSGAYYSYVVATAGYAPTTASGRAPNSICPKNWKLPSSGASGQFQTLYNKYNDYDKMKTAFQAAYTVLCNNSSCPHKNTDAVWWSSAIYSATLGHSMTMDSSIFYPQNNYYKHSGGSVRCVLSSS